MESYGLSLYRLETSQNIRKQYSKLRNINSFSYGQIQFGEAIFLRDPFFNGKPHDQFKWNLDKYKKLIFLYEIFDLDDCAYELIDFLNKKKFIYK